jgi:hypothetical protein
MVNNLSEKKRRSRTEGEEKWISSAGRGGDRMIIQMDLG